MRFIFFIAAILFLSGCISYNEFAKRKYMPRFSPTSQCKVLFTDHKNKFKEVKNTKETVAVTEPVLSDGIAFKNAEHYAPKLNLPKEKYSLKREAILIFSTDTISKKIQEKNKLETETLISEVCGFLGTLTTFFGIPFVFS